MASGMTIKTKVSADEKAGVSSPDSLPMPHLSLRTAPTGVLQVVERNDTEECKAYLDGLREQIGNLSERVNRLDGLMRRAPLHVAAENGNVDIMKLLIDANADINLPDGDGATPLHWASAHNGVDAVKLLLGLHCNPTVADNYLHDLPLHWAAAKGHVKVASLLVSAGSNPGAVNKHGWTPIHMAAANGHGDMIRFLLGRGADPNVQNNKGNTALHLACAGSQVWIVEVLVAAGVRTDIKNEEGFIAYEMTKNDLISRELVAADANEAMAMSPTRAYAAMRKNPFSILPQMDVTSNYNTGGTGADPFAPEEDYSHLRRAAAKPPAKGSGPPKKCSVALPSMDTVRALWGEALADCKTMGMNACRDDLQHALSEASWAKLQRLVIEEPRMLLKPEYARLLAYVTFLHRLQIPEHGMEMEIKRVKDDVYFMVPLVWTPLYQRAEFDAFSLYWLVDQAWADENFPKRAPQGSYLVGPQAEPVDNTPGAVPMGMGTLGTIPADANKALSLLMLGLKNTDKKGPVCLVKVGPSLVARTEPHVIILQKTLVNGEWTTPASIDDKVCPGATGAVLAHGFRTPAPSLEELSDAGVELKPLLEDADKK